jgi:acyl carrier protein
MITKEELSDRLISIVKSYIHEDEMPESINYDMDLTNDLGINSMHVIDIVIDIENEYDITIEDDELQNMTTLNKVLGIIMAKLEEN